MGVTGKLLKLYRVDQQLRGLKSRLRQAEGYLRTQETSLADLTNQKASLDSQIRQLRATNANDENETNAIDQRIAFLRERMTQAATTKEHNALLTETSTLKADKAEIERRILDAMGKIEDLQSRAAALDAQLAERRKVHTIATADRDKRAEEIKDRVTELDAERAEALKDVPTTAMAIYQDALARGIDEVMAPIEEADRKSLEYTCGSCYTHLPIERVSVLLNRGDITTCPACDTILYIEETLRTSINDTGSKKSAGTTRRKKAAIADGE